MRKLKVGDKVKLLRGWDESSDFSELLEDFESSGTVMEIDVGTLLTVATVEALTWSSNGLGVTFEETNCLAIGSSKEGNWLFALPLDGFTELCEPKLETEEDLNELYAI